MHIERNRDKRFVVIAVVLIVSCAALVAYKYFRQVHIPALSDRFELHQQILSGTAVTPYRYRVLAPLLGEGLTRCFMLVIHGHRKAFVFGFAAYDLFAITFVLLSLFSLLRRWFPQEYALIGVLFVAATMPIALQDHGYQPWSLLETGLFTLAIICIDSKRPGALALIVTVASFNRETAVFMPLAFVLANADAVQRRDGGFKIDWKPLMWAGTYFLIWAVIYGGIRICQGAAPPVDVIASLLARNANRGSLIFTVLHVSLFLGGMWFFAALGLRTAPTLFRRLAWMIPPYLLTIALWGVWYEVRLLMPLYPILLPLGMSFICHYLNDSTDPVQPSMNAGPVEISE